LCNILHKIIAKINKEEGIGRILDKGAIKNKMQKPNYESLGI
jgi:hypothetical protein